MISATKCLTNFNELHFEKLACEIHRDLPRNGESLDAGFRSEAFGCDSPATSHDLLHLVDGRKCLGRRQSVFTRTNFVRERLSGQLDRDFLVLQRREQQQLNDTTLELADVRAHVLRYKAQHIVRDGQLEMILFLLLPEDGDAVL